MTKTADYEIRRGGKLIRTFWHFDPEVKEGDYLDDDVTDSAFSKLFGTCTIEEGLTLKDILLLLNSNIFIFDAVIGNWCRELVVEGLRESSSKEKSSIEYLELYWDLYKEGNQSLSSYAFPSLHGIGFAQKEDLYQNQILMCKAGARINYAVELTPANELAHLPIRLASELTITDQSYKPDDLLKFKECEYTLGQILYGVVWELSFFGNPASRDKMGEELANRVKDIEDGKVKTIPWEEVKTKLEKKLKGGKKPKDGKKSKKKKSDSP